MEPDDIMTAAAWEKFWELLNEITSAGAGAYRERAAAVRAAALEAGCEEDLEEFASWFAE